MTGRIRPAAAAESARPAKAALRPTSDGANCTCSIPRTVTPRRPASSGSISVNPPLGAPWAENRPSAATIPNAAAPIAPPAPSKTTFRTSAAGQVAYALRPARIGVVGHGVGTELAGEIELAGAPSGRDHVRTCGARELDQQDAEATGGGRDEHPLVRVDPGARLESEGGGAVVDQRGRFGQLHPVRDGDDALQRCDGAVRVAAGPAGDGDDGPSDPGPVDTIADN